MTLNKKMFGTKRHIASWLLLAVFVPMLLLSSVHIHETHDCCRYVGSRLRAVPVPDTDNADSRNDGCHVIYSCL